MEAPASIPAPGGHPRPTTAVVARFFGVFGGICVVALAAMIGYDGVLTALTYRWSPVPCKIITSQVGEVWHGQERRFQIEVAYEYVMGGKTYRSRNFTSRERFSGIDYSSPDYAEVARQATAYLAGSNAICFVDPTDASAAILERRNLWFYPIALASGPVFICLYVLFKRKLSRPHGPAPDSSPPSDVPARRTSSESGVLITAGIGLVAIGGLIGYGSNTKPAEQSKAAMAWPEVPCVIVSSHVREVSQRHGTTYSPDILYAYRMNDQEFKSNRHRFDPDGSDSSEKAVAIVEKYPPGSRAICYVNPAAPTDSVLIRETKTDYFPWLMILGGVGTAILGFRIRRTGQRLTLPPDLDGLA